MILYEKGHGDVIPTSQRFFKSYFYVKLRFVLICNRPAYPIKVRINEKLNN